MSVTGIDLVNKEVVFVLCPESTPTDPSGDSSTGFIFNSMYDLSYALRYRTRGGSSSTYNDSGMYHFAASGASITAIVVELMPGQHIPYFDSQNNRKECFFLYNDSGDSSSDIDIPSNEQILLFRSSDVNNRARFSQGMTLQEAIDLASSEGSSAYDMIGDGTIQGSTLTGLMYAISGDFIDTSDSGSIGVNNPDKFLDAPGGYDRNGTMRNALTGSLNSDYSILRFGPVYHGTTGYCMPAIYAEDGRLANENQDVPAASRIYDLIRGMSLDLPSTSDYEILGVSPGLMNSSTTSNLSTINNPKREYLTGKYYDDPSSWTPRAEGDTYPQTLSGMENSYPGITDVNYAGVDSAPLITKYRDLFVRIPENGQYLKVRNSKLSTVFNTLTASMVSSSAANVRDGFGYAMGFAPYNANKPLKVRLENIDFQYLGQHCYDGSKNYNSSASAVYGSSPSTSGSGSYSTYIDNYVSSTGSPNGLTGYHRNYDTLTLNRQYAIYSYNTQRIEIDNCRFMSIHGNGCYHAEVNITSYRPGGSLTGMQKTGLTDCEFSDISYIPMYSGLSIPSGGPLASTQYLEYPSSADTGFDCSFNRCGDRPLIGNSGPNAAVTGCLFNRMRHLYAGYSKQGFTGFYTMYGGNPSLFASNTAYNCMTYFQTNNITISGNYTEYDVHADKHEFFGGGGGMSMHNPGDANCVQITINDNQWRRTYTDGILFEGISPGTPSYDVGSTISGDRANLLENISFHDNLLTKNPYRVRRPEEGNDFNGSAKYGPFNPSVYPLIGFSDVMNIDVYNNTFLGNEMEEDRLTVTASGGETISAGHSYGFTVDSTSALNMYNNKIANVTSTLFLLSEGSGSNYPYEVIGSGVDYKTMGQVNDFSFFDNTIYNVNKGLMLGQIGQYSTYNPINESLDNSIYGSYSFWQTNELNMSATLSAMGLYGDNICLSGIGDAAQYHNGKSLNGKGHDNRFIQDFSSDFFTFFGIQDSGYETVDNAIEGVVPQGIGFLHNSSALRRDQSTTAVFGEEYAFRPDLYAEFTPFGDNDSVLSGNIFYGFDKAKRNIEGLVYKSDSEAIDYVTNNFSTDPIIQGGRADALNFSAVSAANYQQGKDLSSSSNWGFHEQNVGNEYYQYGNFGQGFTYFSASGSDYALVPRLARIRQDAEDDSLLTITGGVDHLNTTVSGGKGAENAVEDTIPLLNYTFDINNPASFLEASTISSSISTNIDSVEFGTTPFLTPFNVINVGQRTFDYTVVRYPTNLYSLTYDKEISASGWTVFCVPSNVGTLTANQTSSNLILTSSYSGTYPDSISGILTISADDGITKELEATFQRLSTGTLSANYLSYSFAYDEPATGTITLYNLHGSQNLSFQFLYTNPYVVDFDTTSESIGINHSSTASATVIGAGSSASFDFQIDSSYISEAQGYQGQISLLTSDGGYLIPVNVSNIGSIEGGTNNYGIKPSIDNRFVLINDLSNVISVFRQNTLSGHELFIQGIQNNVTTSRNVPYKLSPLASFGYKIYQIKGNFAEYVTYMMKNAFFDNGLESSQVISENSFNKQLTVQNNILAEYIIDWILGIKTQEGYNYNNLKIKGVAHDTRKYAEVFVSREKPRTRISKEYGSVSQGTKIVIRK